MEKRDYVVMKKELEISEENSLIIVSKYYSDFIFSEIFFNEVVDSAMIGTYYNRYHNCNLEVVDFDEKRIVFSYYDDFSDILEKIVFYNDYMFLTYYDEHAEETFVRSIYDINNGIMLEGTTEELTKFYSKYKKDLSNQVLTREK